MTDESKKTEKKEVLVAFLPHKGDFAILQEQNWYRIPVNNTPKRFPPDYLAFYQPKSFGNDAFRIRYYGRVINIEKISRRELFPNEIVSEKADRLYYRITIEHLEKHPRPIPSYFPRKFVFLPTTWDKFINADELNDLFDESYLEDLLWAELKKRKIRAERQWPVKTKQSPYKLDFAIFCNKANLDIETDGDFWHANKERASYDNERNNAIESLGWHVLRYNTNQVTENQAEYCINNIQENINRYNGLKDDGLVPRKFYPDEGDVQQLTLFEDQAEYSIGDENLD